MKILIGLLLVVLCACSTVHSWQIDVHKSASARMTPALQTNMINGMIEELHRRFARWDIKFSMTEGEGHLQIWDRDVRLLGRAYFGFPHICKEYPWAIGGVYWNDTTIYWLKNYDAERKGYVMGIIAAHEVCHVYGLRHNTESPDNLMNPVVPFKWANKPYLNVEQIAHLDKKLGVK